MIQEKKKNIIDPAVEKFTLHKQKIWIKNCTEQEDQELY